jgi:hypothetical protein
MKKNSANQISATNYQPIPASIMEIFEEIFGYNGFRGVAISIC